MKTGIRIFPKTKRSGQRKQARREMVDMRRKLAAVEERVENTSTAPSEVSGPGVKMGTIRALERRIQEKDKAIETLTMLVAEVADKLPPKAKKQLSDDAKLILKIQ